MVIVAGTIELDPDQREAFLAGRIDGMRTSRAEPGCLEYTLSADPTDPRRVMLFERWVRQEDLDAHLAASRARPHRREPPWPQRRRRSSSTTLPESGRWGGESRQRTDHLRGRATTKTQNSSSCGRC